MRDYLRQRELGGAQRLQCFLKTLCVRSPWYLSRVQACGMFLRDLTPHFIMNQRGRTLWTCTVKLETIGQPGLWHGSWRWPTRGGSKVRPQSKILADLRFGCLSWQFYFVALRSVDSKTLATLAFLDAFGSEQGVLTYFADLSGPAWHYQKWAREIDAPLAIQYFQPHPLWYII